VVTSTVDIVRCYCDLCVDYCGYNNSRYSSMVLCFVGVYCGYSNSRYSAMVLSFDGDYCGYSNRSYSAMVLGCVEFILFTATGDIVQWYCVVSEIIVVTAKVDIVQFY